MSTPQELLCQKVKAHGSAAVARMLGVNEATVRTWATGKRNVGEKAGARITAALGKEKPKAPDSPPPTGDPTAECLATIAGLRAALAQLNADPDAPVKEKAQVATALTGATRLLAKLTGEADVSTAMILKSPAWRQLQAVLLDALRPYPDAMAAIVAAVDGAKGG